MEDALAKRSDTFTQDLSSLKQATKLRVIRAGCGGRFPVFLELCWMKGKQVSIFCVMIMVVGILDHVRSFTTMNYVNST